MTWPVVPLAEVAEVRLGRQRAPKNHLGDSMRPYIRAANVTWAGLDLSDVKSMNFTDDEMATYRMEPGDIVLSEASGSPGEVGKPALWSGEIAECAFQNTLIRVRPRQHEPKFLVHYFRYLALGGQFVEYSRGVGIHHLGRARLASWPTPVPPVEEQRRIIDLLEDHISRLDAADAYLDTARRREAVLHDQLLTSMLSSVPCGDVPLRDVLTAGLSNGRSVTTREGGFPVLRLTALRDGRIDLAERKAGAWTAEEAARFLVEKGDFLISRGNGSLRLVGRAGLVVDDPDPVAYPDTLIRARPAADKIVPDYLALVWNAPGVRRQIEKAAKTTAGIYKVNQKDLAAIRVPVTALEDQAQVVDAVGASRNALGRLSGEVRAARVRSAALRRSILAAAFSGRLTGGWELTGV